MHARGAEDEGDFCAEGAGAEEEDHAMGEGKSVVVLWGLRCGVWGYGVRWGGRKGGNPRGWNGMERVIQDG